MPATEKVSYALTPETVRRIVVLSKLWGGVDPMAKSRVVSEAIDRAYDIETRRERTKNGQKKS
jgi:hypothetical protein